MNMMRKCQQVVIALCLSLLIVPNCQAEEPLTLNDCLRYARDHALENKQIELSYEIARKNKLSAACNFLPYISASTSGQISFGRSIDPETNTYVTKQTLSNGYGVSLSLPLFSGLANLNNLRMYKALEKSGKENVQIQKDKTSFAVIDAFYQCIYYKQTVMQVEAQLKNDQKNLKRGERMNELGANSKADLAQLEANVASNEFSLIQQQNLYELAIISLKASMKWPLDSILEIQEDIAQSEMLFSDIPDEQTLAREFANIQPEANAALWQLKASQYALKKSIGYYFPSISFSAGYSTSFYRTIGGEYSYPSFSEQIKNNGGEYLSISLSIPIFTRLSNTNNYKISKLNYRKEQLNYENTIDVLEQAIIQAVLDMRGAYKEYLSAQKKLKAVSLAHDACAKKYEQGLLSALDLFNSSSQLAEANAQVTGKAIQFLIKKKQVEYYQGVPLIQESNI